MVLFAIRCRRVDGQYEVVPIFKAGKGRAITRNALKRRGETLGDAVGSVLLLLNARGEYTQLGDDHGNQ